MNEIMKTLIRLASGRYNLEEAAAANREKRDVQEVGMMVASLNGGREVRMGICTLRFGEGSPPE